MTTWPTRWYERPLRCLLGIHHWTPSHLGAWRYCDRCGADTRLP